jgi:flagellar motor switch protein FliN
MAEDSESIGQDAVDEILRQDAATAAGGTNPAAAQPGAAPLNPAEVEALLKQNAPAGAAAASPPRAAAERPGAASGAIAQGDIDLLLNQAEQALASIQSSAQAGPPPGTVPFRLQDFAGAPATSENATLDLIRDIDLDLRIELGRTRMYLEDVLKLGKGAVVPLDKLAGDPVDIYANGRLIARGEVLILNDNFCVRVAELVAGENAPAA